MINNEIRAYPRAKIFLADKIRHMEIKLARLKAFYASLPMELSPEADQGLLDLFKEKD